MLDPDDSKLEDLLEAVAGHGECSGISSPSRWPNPEVPGACNWSTHKGHRPHRQAHGIALSAWRMTVADQTENHQISNRTVREIHRFSVWASRRSNALRHLPDHPAKGGPGYRMPILDWGR
jgi:hypothetical protein